MWTNYSLVVRLWLLLCAMILVALMASMVLLVIYSRAQLPVEHEPGSRVAGQVAKAFNQALANTTDPDGVLRGFDLGLDNNAGTVTFETTADEAAGVATDNSSASNVDGVPAWFVRLLIAPNISDRFPIYVAGHRAGDLVFKANLSADLSERWLTFIGILTSAVILAIISSFISYFTVGATLRPLRGIETGLTQLRAGDYDVHLPCEGPPEIRKSCRELNDLASTLSELSSENTRLLRRLVILEEQEDGIFRASFMMSSVPCCLRFGPTATRCWKDSNIPRKITLLLPSSSRLSRRSSTPIAGFWIACVQCTYENWDWRGA